MTVKGEGRGARGELNETQDLAARRARLAAIDRELDGLRSQHDLAMSAFKFDEASALQRRIEAIEDERRAFAAALPPVAAAAEPPLGVVPRLARPRHRRRR
jgi:hypothetical protein